MSMFITLLALGTALLNASLVLAVILIFSAKWREYVLRIIRGNALFIVFMLAVASIVGTLAIEYVGLLLPCELCWWQRIFMYPIALVSGVAFIKNVSFADIVDYVLVLAIPGALVALYQHLLQILPTGSLIPCGASGECAVRSVFEFGYITIPWMAVSVFAVLIFIALVARKNI